MKTRKWDQGFTLIELLIVVAIIAILAAIAVPNFLEAQTRAKVSRVRSDLRALLTGVESYQVDHSKYPLHMLVSQTSNQDYADPWLGAGGGFAYNEFHFSRLYSLTTPIAYMNTIPLDPFFRRGAPVNPGDSIAATGARPARQQYMYANSRFRNPSQDINHAAGHAYGEFVMWSGGPDGFRRDIYLRGDAKDSMRIYDPSNGTLSVGDIWRTHKSPDGSRPTVPGYVE